LVSKAKIKKLLDLTPKGLGVPYVEFKVIRQGTVIPISSGFLEKNLVDGEFQGLSNKPLQARFGHFFHELCYFVFFLCSEGSLGRAPGH
jgi:hypothetical protein